MAVEHRLQAAERALDEHERSQLRYADALTAWGEAGGYDAEVVESDTAAVAALGLPWHEVRDRPVATLSGGEHHACLADQRRREAGGDPSVR